MSGDVDEMNVKERSRLVSSLETKSDGGSLSHVDARVTWGDGSCGSSLSLLVDSLNLFPREYTGGSRRDDRRCATDRSSNTLKIKKFVLRCPPRCRWVVGPLGVSTRLW